MTVGETTEVGDATSSQPMAGWLKLYSRRWTIAVHQSDAGAQPQPSRCRSAGVAHHPEQRRAGVTSTRVACRSRRPEQGHRGLLGRVQVGSRSRAVYPDGALLVPVSGERWRSVQPVPPMAQPAARCAGRRSSGFSARVHRACGYGSRPAR
jgi:hypothetical protein